MRSCALAAVALLAVPSTLMAQIIIPERPIRPVPHPLPSVYRIKSVDVQADIHDQAAKVRIQQVFENTGSGNVEAQFGLLSCIESPSFSVRTPSQLLDDF